jgi:hypothetical protein
VDDAADGTSATRCKRRGRTALHRNRRSVEIISALIELPRWPLASLASAAARADEPGSGECPARALIELPRWPLASLASAAVAKKVTRRSVDKCLASSLPTSTIS